MTDDNPVRRFFALVDELKASVDRADWERDNLCGVCPYRQAIQARANKLEELLEASVDRLLAALAREEIARAALAGVPAEPATEDLPCPECRGADGHSLECERGRPASSVSAGAKVLADNVVCSCLDETGERRVRLYERCERCGAFMAAAVQVPADTWQPLAERTGGDGGT